MKLLVFNVRWEHLTQMKNDSFDSKNNFLVCKMQQAIICDQYHNPGLMKPHRWLIDV